MESGSNKEPHDWILSDCCNTLVYKGNRRPESSNIYRVNRTASCSPLLSMQKRDFLSVVIRSRSFRVTLTHLRLAADVREPFIRIQSPRFTLIVRRRLFSPFAPLAHNLENLAVTPRRRFQLFRSNTAEQMPRSRRAACARRRRRSCWVGGAGVAADGARGMRFDWKRGFWPAAAGPQAESRCRGRKIRPPQLAPPGLIATLGESGRRRDRKGPLIFTDTR